VTDLRVLHLTTELPHPTAISGGSSRQFHLLTGLASLGVEVTVVAPVSDAQSAELRPLETLRERGVDLLVAPRQRTRGREAVLAFAREPRLLTRSLSMPLHALQTEMLAQGMRGPSNTGFARNPNIISIEHDYATALLDVLPHAADSIVKVLTLQNVTAEYYRVRAESSSGVRRFVHQRSSRAATRYITSQLKHFDTLIAVSEYDAQLTKRSAPDANVVVIPNGTATADPKSIGRRSDLGNTVLFTGTMSHPPNSEGASWFLDEIWPIIKLRVPDARFVIVGREPSADLFDAAHKLSDVEVIGEVPSMASWYESSTVSVAPLLSGSGTRLKILDSMSGSCPVVTTSLGCQGLDVQHGEHVLIADAAQEFASRVIEALELPDKREQLAGAGRRLVEENYDWAKLSAKFKVVLEDALSRGGRSGS